jgi:HSP20 family protein
MAEKRKKKPFSWVWESGERGLEPLDELENMQRKLWSGLWRVPQQAFRIDVPANLSETSDKLILRAELPGFKKSEIILSVTEDRIELSAEKKYEGVEKGETFYRRESEHRSVQRSFSLPVEINPDKVDAKLEDGVLTVAMDKMEKSVAKKKSVEIK